MRGYTQKTKQIYKIKKNKIIILAILLSFIIIQIIDIKHNNKNLTPKISIFLPIYNKAMFLDRSIRSIQIQSLRNIEIIAVNDCSEDNSLEVLSFFHLL